MNVTQSDGPALGATTAGGAAVGSSRSWTFLTNHAHVLVALAVDPELRIRDLATHVGITERAAQRILSDLVADGYVHRDRHGRRNAYRLVLDLPLRHHVEAGHTVGDLVLALRAVA